MLIRQGGIAGNSRDLTIIVKNSYSSGDISGTNAGAIVGWHNWNPTAAEAINCYYSTSEKVTNTVGKAGYTVNATGVEKLTQIYIDALNQYIENDPEGLGTTRWSKWELDANGEPSFIRNN